MMPDIKLVDLKDKYFRKKKGHFSDTLIEEITSAIALGEQVILFQNRRGYSPFSRMHDLWARTALSAM
jgi:primosomal protein N' (replication factor Y)